MSVIQLFVSVFLCEVVSVSLWVFLRDRDPPTTLAMSYHSLPSPDDHQLAVSLLLPSYDALMITMMMVVIRRKEINKIRYN